MYLKATHRVLRYLKASHSQGLFFPVASSLQLRGFANSYWETCQDSRRFVTGFYMFLGDALVSWKSKKQGTMSKSSSETKYQAMILYACEVQCLVFLLDALEVKMDGHVVLFSDSKFAIAIAKNPVLHEHTKHIEMECHLIREKIQKAILKLLHVPTENQLANILTKPL